MRSSPQHKIKSMFLTVLKVKNWLPYFLERLGLLKEPTMTYVFRDGRSYTARTNTADRGIINTVAIQDEYKITTNPPVRGTVIDIGGQNGYFSVFVSKYADVVYTYEPMPENYAMIIKNIENNALQTIIRPHNLAVSKEPGTVVLHLTPKNTGGHSIYGTGRATLAVSTTTLPDIFESNNIDFCSLLKIDAEGAEYDILYNLPDTYFKKIREIRMEVHDIDTKQRHHIALVDFLKTKGYIVNCVMPLLFAYRA